MMLQELGLIICLISETGAHGANLVKIIDVRPDKHLTRWLCLGLQL